MGNRCGSKAISELSVCGYGYGYWLQQHFKDSKLLKCSEMV